MAQNRIEDPPGLVLGGRYRLGQLIGRGGMASVHQARDEALDRTVAIKLFRTDLTDPDELSRQEGEVKLLARLNHPNLVTVFDAGTDTISDGPQMYLVTELVHGTDLRRALHGGALEGDEAARVGTGVAAALEYIHRSGVIHRDVKPANILMNDDDGGGGSHAQPANPKLTDFGIARLVDGARLTATGESLGTAMYFSPEQASGGAISPASDIYALGLVLLECLTAVTAFPGPAVASAAARLHRDPDIPHTLGLQWQQLLRAMTQRNPEDRPSAPAVADALRAIQKGGPVEIGFGADESGVPTTAMRASTTPTAAMPKTHPAAGPRTAGFAPAAGVDMPTEPQQAASSETNRSLEASPRTSGSQAGSVDSGSQAGRQPRTQRAGGLTKRMFWAVLAAALVLAVVVVLTLTLGPGADTTPLEYPQVPGQLGENLEQLQKSVEP